jgi:hypothetical protein
VKPRPFRNLARRFLIRRYGASVNWNCSYREISQVTGIDEGTVSRICRAHGYRLKQDNRGSQSLSVIPVDRYIALSDPIVRSHY